MVEFLTENVRRAYPLEHEWPNGSDERWTRVLVDACIGYDGELSANERVKLISVTRSGTSAVFRIGVSDTNRIDITVPAGRGVFDTVSASPETSRYRAFLVVNGPVLDEAVLKLSDGGSVSVGVPFALRCVSSAIPRVTAISEYTPELCDKPVFKKEARTPIRTIFGGDVVIAAKEGMDADVTTLEPISGNVLRLSAIAAPADTYDADKQVDIMIRGDECFAVETIPGVDSTLSPKAGHGVVLITSKCKPCCQCTDYKDAADALDPASKALLAVEKALDEAKDVYDDAVSTFNAAKIAAKNAINSYSNVHANATSVISGAVYGGSNAAGMRKRLAATLTVENMTLTTVHFNMSGFSIPGYTSLKVTWQTAGKVKRSGNYYPAAATLNPGDTITVVGTYAVASTGPSESGYDSKPSGMSVSFSLKMPGRDTLTKTIDVT